MRVPQYKYIDKHTIIMKGGYLAASNLVCFIGVFHLSVPPLCFKNVFQVSRMR